MPRKPKSPEAPAFTAATFETAEFEAAAFRPADEPEENPLDAIDGTGDPEADSAAEMNAMQAAFAARAKREEQRRTKAIDSEYWVCLCFQSREEVESFLRETRWGRESDKYIDGRKVADALGVKIERDTTPYGKVRIDRKLADLSMDLGVSDLK